MKVDIVITTYNRPDTVLNLVSQLNARVKGFNQIIVIDSSNDEHPILRRTDGLVYVKSPHKNQPFQRILGILNSKSDWVLFLDDDLELINPNFLIEFTDLLKSDSKIVGIGSRILFPGQQPVKRSSTHQAILWFTGEPLMREGKLNLFGEYGGYKDIPVMETEALSGACMMFKHSIAKDLFTDSLLSIFEKRWGMGEDKYLSFRASRKGKLLLFTLPAFAHPPIESTYFVNNRDFQARVLYSRLWLALTIGGQFKTYTYLRYFYYAFWRILISVFKALTGNSEAKEKFLGNLLALQRLFTYGFNAHKITPEINWKNELK